ncbi:hypothetical protein [Methylomonas sp. ZR1]|uniref:hypothetical protein n=1 Tax=Methylomonas sp. ZR1 TaxID=1797072 RepID=UPI00149130B2|nr:hypothetical protein [Methylomonas sp. ZR1]NOV29337.1 hypothetical protein [Methylomonas sp. ZR1]
MSFSLRSSHFLSQWISALLPAVPPRSRATFIRLLRACLVLPVQTLNLVIDDTLAMRHDHEHKTSRPDFVQAQCWVTLSVSVLGHNKAKLVLQIFSRLVSDTGNRNKLPLALALRESWQQHRRCRHGCYATHGSCAAVWFCRCSAVASRPLPKPASIRLVFAARHVRQVWSWPTAEVWPTPDGGGDHHLAGD